MTHVDRHWRIVLVFSEREISTFDTQESRQFPMLYWTRYDEF